ncbi:hypothetical protein GEMRC1_006011 [Eukaryota sp. GEM-RC1]
MTLFDAPELSARSTVKRVQQPDLHPFLDDRGSPRPSSARMVPSSNSYSNPLFTPEEPSFRPTRKLIYGSNNSSLFVPEEKPLEHRPYKRPIYDPIDPSAAGVSTLQETQQKLRPLRRHVSSPETVEERDFKPIRRVVVDRAANETDPVGIQGDYALSVKRPHSEHLRFTSRSTEEQRPNRKKLLCPETKFKSVFDEKTSVETPRHSVKVFPERLLGIGEDVLKYKYHQGVMKQDRPLSVKREEGNSIRSH